MTCDTCGGLVISQWDDHRLEQKCVNCGRRPKTVANSAPRPDQGLHAAPARPQDDEPERPRCTKGHCPEPAAEDSVRCVKHRDMQRAQNQAFAKKQGKTVAPGRKPGRPSAQTAQPKKPAGPLRGESRKEFERDRIGSAMTSPEEARRLDVVLQADRPMTTEEKAKTATAIFPDGTNAAASWEEWKFLVLAQLQDAERKLREKIDAVQHAILTIEAL